MLSRLKKYNLSNAVLFLLLFLACFNFMGRGPIIYFMFCVYGILITWSFRFNQTCLLYLVLSVFAGIASFFYYDFAEIIKSSVYFLSFYVGYILCMSQKRTLAFFTHLILWGVLGFVASLLLFGYLNIIIIGHTAGVRVMISPWTMEEIQVTLIGLLSSVPLIYSFYCLFCQEKIYLKLLGLLMIIISFVINMETATRTPFLLFGLVYMIMFYVLLKGSSFQKKIQAIFLFLLFLVLALFLLERYATELAIAERFSDEGLETSRIYITKLYFQHMWEYPFGGGFVEKTYHYMAHNLLQESYDMFGMFFFFSLIIVIVGIIKRGFRLYRIKDKSSLSFMLISLYIGITLQVMMEPVIVGYPQLIWLFFLIDGITLGAFSRKEELLMKEDDAEIISINEIIAILDKS